MTSASAVMGSPVRSKAVLYPSSSKPRTSVIRDSFAAENAPYSELSGVSPVPSGRRSRIGGHESGDIKDIDITNGVAVQQHLGHAMALEQMGLGKL